MGVRFEADLAPSSLEALADLEQALDRNTAALVALTHQEAKTMATLEDLTAVAEAIAADDSALKSAIDGLVAAINAATSLSPADQAALDAAVSSLQTAHADLKQQAADATATPPIAP